MPNSFRHLKKSSREMPKQVRQDDGVIVKAGFRITTGHISKTIEFPDDLSLIVDY